MSHPVLPQNDFFIYVPSLQKDEFHSHSLNVDEEPSLRVEAMKPPAKLRAWVKIPLAGTVCVYVNLDRVHEEGSRPN